MNEVVIVIKMCKNESLIQKSKNFCVTLSLNIPQSL